ncbi:MAG TPA: VOC family protein [Candidatus Dormibacteraeota bacterium]|nr:VOC family protein [Candidatus Dormibacteraeota bacterium]
MSEQMPASPEPIQFISAVLLTSDDPDRLVTFYREILGVPLVPERHGDGRSHFGCELGDVHFAIHPAVGTSPGGALKLALWVFDLASLVARLDALGVPLEYPIENLGEASLVTAVRDPDGNEVELTQMGDSWWQHLADRRAEGIDLNEPEAPTRLSTATLPLWWLGVTQHGKVDQLSDHRRRRGLAASFPGACPSPLLSQLRARSGQGPTCPFPKSVRESDSVNSCPSTPRSLQSRSKLAGPGGGER